MVNIKYIAIGIVFGIIPFIPVYPLNDIKLYSFMEIHKICNSVLGGLHNNCAFLQYVVPILFGLALILISIGMFNRNEVNENAN